MVETTICWLGRYSWKWSTRNCWHFTFNEWIETIQFVEWNEHGKMFWPQSRSKHCGSKEDKASQGKKSMLMIRPTAFIQIDKKVLVNSCISFHSRTRSFHSDPNPVASLPSLRRLGCYSWSLGTRFNSVTIYFLNSKHFNTFTSILCV